MCQQELQLPFLSGLFAYVAPLIAEEKEESKAEDYVNSDGPWGWRGKGNERIFKINKFTSQEELFPRICVELPAIG